MDEGQRLLVTLEARVNKYERDLERAHGKTGKNFRSMRKEAEKAGTGIEKAMNGASKSLSAFGKGLIGGVVGGLAIGGLDQIISRVGDVAKGVANIGSEAKRAGLSSKAFQELKFVAEQNRIEVDALVDGMKELSLRADEFITTGKGSAAHAFQRLGFSAQELKRKLADPSALLVEIIGRLEQLDKAAQIRIADEIFGGTGGERFVALIDQGAEGIRQTIKEANDLGLVLDEDIIRRADEIDRKFSKIAQTVGTALKGAIVEVVSAMNDWLDRFNKVEEQTDRNLQRRLAEVYAQRQEVQQNLAGATNDRQRGLWANQLRKLTEEALKLRDILDRRTGYDENFIYKTGKDAKGATSPVNSLNKALSGTGSTASKSALGIDNYADAIRALKNEVPELAASLRDLDAKARIDETYRVALAKAQGQREVALANEMRGQALATLSIRSATDDPANYLSTLLAKGRGADSINGMAGEFREKLAKMIASMPDDLKGMVTINSGFRSIKKQQQLWLAALKKYGSPEAARKWVAPPGNSQHNKGNAADLGYGNDRAREWVHANANRFGLSFPLGNEDWHIEDANARSGQVAAEIERLTSAAKSQSDAYRQIISGAREHTAAQRTEQQALGMSVQQAQAFRYEQQMLAQAQRDGITLTAQQRQEIAQLAQGMARADASVELYAASQEQAGKVSKFFGEQAVDALSGLLTGTMTAEQALKQLLQTLIRATLQAAILGEGPLAGLFGGGSKMEMPSAGGGGKKGFGSLFGAMLGFADGGPVRGPGNGTSDSIPARLSNGEFVVNAKATAKNRALLEAINSGHVASFATGGLVGDVPALARPEFASANGNANGDQAISINAPITVNGSAGTPEQNEDLAKRMRRELEGTMRGVVVDEMRKQTRPGNMLRRH